MTTEYLSTRTGRSRRTPPPTGGALAGAATLFNGSDNGLIDLFVDPTLGCSPWQVPNLADGGALAPALPLDELQAARYAGRANGNPAALVPLNDPMTLDGNGNISTDKTNTYRSLVDMPPLPAGESPTAYCSDMEQIQSTRIQQDFNLLMKNPGPAPDAASNLFKFLAMRLQQSYAEPELRLVRLAERRVHHHRRQRRRGRGLLHRPGCPDHPGRGQPHGGDDDLPGDHRLVVVRNTGPAR